MERIGTDSGNPDAVSTADITPNDNEHKSEVGRLDITSESAFVDEKRVSPLLNETIINDDHENACDISSNDKMVKCGSHNDEKSVSKHEERGSNVSEYESEKILLNYETVSCTTSATGVALHENVTSNENGEVVKESNEYRYDWQESPILLCSATEEYKPTPLCENITKGCQWSPDGTCLLVPSEDFKLRVYELPKDLYSGKVSQEPILPPLTAALSVKEGGVIYDSCWFPLMNSWDPSTCCFASTSRECPVHLWDAFTGELRATYRAYNQVDAVEAAISVQFINSGAELWCGFKGALRTFHTERPGRQVNTISLKKDIPNVTGIVSCIRENPAMPGLVAFGTYSKTIGTFDRTTESHKEGLYKDGPLCALKTESGVTQIEFSPCGMKLYSGVRRNNEMLCWDLRNPGGVLYSIQGRKADTNQRIQFSISPDGQDLVSGGTDGFVSVWQLDENNVLKENLESKRKFKLSIDCVNGVSLHKSLPIMSTSSGQRICEEEEEENEGSQFRDNSVRLWWCGPKR